MLNFNKLTNAFPGRIKLSRKQPDEDRSKVSSGTDAQASKASEDSRPDSAPQSSSLTEQQDVSQTGCSPRSSTDAGLTPQPSYEDSRKKRFQLLLQQPIINLQALQEASWTGIPPELRPMCWRLLLGYQPPNQSRAQSTVHRKRREYRDMVPVYYDIDNQQRSDDDIADLKQVSVDVPRTAPDVPFFQQAAMQASLRRLLYIWGIRHPASGYVQGVNDLATPFLAVFLSEYLPGDIATWQAASLPPAQLLDAEADAYWCLCKLVERVQDAYTAGQPGIQKCLYQLEELVSRVDAGLAAHLREEGVQYIQFAFRWINCMLIREMPFSAALRLWDTYLAEGMRFSEFLPYVCAAFLLHWRERLVHADFQEALLFLQRVPTAGWTGRHLEVVLSHAHMLRASFDDAESHLRNVSVGAPQ